MNKIKIKSGAVSIYVVVFLTLIFGVITMSFIRIVLNDAIETTNTDLYRSAYDSALAGVEDAKIALLKYHDCLSQGEVGSSGAASGTCANIIYEMEQGANADDCDVVQRVLGRSQEDQNEVIVQETQNSTDVGNSYDLSQAYTCVKITEETDDYLTTLSTLDDNRIIPLRSVDTDSIKAIEFSWYAASNGGTNYMNSSYLMPNNTQQAYTPPIVTLDIFQTDTNADGACGWGVESDAPCFNLGELSVNNSNSTGTDHAVLVFRPTDGGGQNYVTAGEVLDHSDKDDNAPINVSCDRNNNFYCTVTIELPDTFRHTPRATATSFLRATLPYERPNTDVAVTLCKGVSSGTCTEKTKFTGVQAAIDSTGRANDLYRRIETRVELVDIYYPYPNYALYLSGEGNAANKNFYVTNTCWQTDNGGAGGCQNSAPVTWEVTEWGYED